jgi:hypothetical protein
MDYTYQNTYSGVNSGNLSQVFFALAFVVVTYLVLLFIDSVYNYIYRLSLNKTVLLPNTSSTDFKTIILSQNPNVPGSKVVHLSNDERSGIEFSYSFYLYVNPSSFTEHNGLLHIFHKGYSSQFPLLAPGVYMRSDTNTLRVYMNTYKTWNNYVEVDNIPVSKWVHVTIVCNNNSLEIFINGNLKKKLSFDGYPPYQNYQDIVCFSQKIINMTSNASVPSLDEGGFVVKGAMKGLISNLTYYSYALCYAEIQTIMAEGPSSKMDSALDLANVPPYLDDKWWTQGY